jgi:hypothetical protein
VASTPDKTSSTSATDKSLASLSGKRWKLAADKAVDRRKEVALSVPSDAGSALSPLSSTTGQVALIVVVVGLVGGLVAAFTLRPRRRYYY